MTTQSAAEKKAAAEAKKEEEAAKSAAEAVLKSIAVTDIQIQRQFQSQEPTPEQQANMDRITEAARAFAQVIKDNTLGSADQTAAIRLVRQARYTANDCVMLRGK